MPSWREPSARVVRRMSNPSRRRSQHTYNALAKYISHNDSAALHFVLFVHACAPSHPPSSESPAVAHTSLRFHSCDHNDLDGHAVICSSSALSLMSRRVSAWQASYNHARER